MIIKPAKFQTLIITHHGIAVDIFLFVSSTVYPRKNEFIPIFDILLQK